MNRIRPIRAGRTPRVSFHDHRVVEYAQALLNWAARSSRESVWLVAPQGMRDSRKEVTPDAYFYFAPDCPRRPAVPHNLSEIVKHYGIGRLATDLHVRPGIGQSWRDCGGKASFSGSWNRSAVWRAARKRAFARPYLVLMNSPGVPSSACKETPGRAGRLASRAAGHHRPAEGAWLNGPRRPANWPAARRPLLPEVVTRTGRRARSKVV